MRVPEGGSRPRTAREPVIHGTSAKLGAVSQGQGQVQPKWGPAGMRRRNRSPQRRRSWLSRVELHWSAHEWSGVRTEGPALPMPPGSEAGTQQSRNSKWEPGLPGCYEERLVRREGWNVSYLRVYQLDLGVFLYLDPTNTNTSPTFLPHTISGIKGVSRVGSVQ